MTSKGDKIAAALQQYAESDIAGDLEYIVNTLQNHPLRGKHFERGKAFMEARLESAKEKIYAILEDNADANPNIALHNRYMHLYLVYMTAGKENHGLYTPAVERIVLRQNQVDLVDRHFPMRLVAPHIEYRHVERSGKALNYQEEPFLFTVAFSLALSKALEPSLPKDSSHEIPIVIPQPDGLFLGTARRVSSDAYTHINRFLATYDEKEGGILYCPPSEWLPTVEITARTYVHSRDFFSGRRKLHQTLMPFYEDEEKLNALGQNVASYILGNSSALENGGKKALESAIHDLTKIVQGPVWAQEVKLPVAMRTGTAVHHQPR